MHVGKATDQLLEVESSSVFVESAAQTYEVEQLTSGDKFQDNVVNLLVFLSRLADHSLLGSVDLHNVGVVQDWKSFDLYIGTVIVLIWGKDFDSISGIAGVSSQFDFTTEPTAKGSFKDELVV